MRRLARLIFLLPTALSGVFVIVAAFGQEKAPDYFPVKVGTKWTYQFSQNGKNVKVNTQIAKVEKIDGKSLSLLETSFDGNVSVTEHLDVNEKGVFRHRINGVELSPPVCVLKYPLTKGSTWETEATIANEPVKIKGKVVESEEVTVPAGKYRAFRVEIESSVAGLGSTMTYWFAPDVGVIKQSTESAGKDVSIVLEKFEPGP